MDVAIAVGSAAVLVTVAAAVRATWSPCGLSMVSSMNRLAERGRGHRFPVTATLFVVAATVGGLLVGLVAAGGAALFALLPRSEQLGAVLAVAACLVALAADLPGSRLRLPTHPRQVDESWLVRYRRWIYATGFGLQIGSGFATYIMSAATYLVPVLGVLSCRPVVALSLGGGFGLIRGLAVLVGSRVRSTEELIGTTRALDRWAPWSMVPVLATEVTAVLVLLLAVPAGWILPAALMLVGVLAVGGRRRAAVPVGRSA